MTKPTRDMTENTQEITPEQALTLCSIQDIKSTLMEKTPLDEEFIQSVVDEIPRLGDAGTEYNMSAMSDTKQNKPVLIDANTLTAALYNRFHKDEQISNITMVPLGDVIQFIKDTPATFDMDKVCDKLDDFLNYHYSVEADARPSEIIESCGSITWEELDMPSSYDMSDEAKDEENDIERD